MKVAKGERAGEQSKDVEKGMMSEISTEAYNTDKTFTKTQQHKSAVRIQQWKHRDGKHSCSKQVD